MSTIVAAQNLKKEFLKGTRPKLTLKERFLHPFESIKQQKFLAVNDLSFEINQGEFFGIIGRNGSGKSTLLKLLAGVLEPTSGNLDIKGKIIPFLELGVGFNPELTARENVYLNGTILGMTRRQIDAKFDEIIEFSEINEFVDTQVKNFSSGMYVRLAFAIAAQADGDIYLIDEILAVGDFAFQQKCEKLFRKLKSEGKTFILVTHDMGSVREYCDRAMYIKGGKLVNIGQTEDVIKDYILHDRQGDTRLNVVGTDLGRDTDLGGNMHIEVLDTNDNPVDTTVNDSPIKIRINYELSEQVLHDKNLIIGFGIYRNGNEFVFGTNSNIEKFPIEFKTKGYVDFVIGNFPLLHGTFGVSGAIHNKDNFHYVWKDNYTQFSVVKVSPRDGIINLPTQIETK